MQKYRKHNSQTIKKTADTRKKLTETKKNVPETIERSDNSDFDQALNFINNFKHLGQPANQILNNIPIYIINIEDDDIGKARRLQIIQNLKTNNIKNWHFTPGIYYKKLIQPSRSVTSFQYTLLNGKQCQFQVANTKTVDPGVIGCLCAHYLAISNAITNTKDDVAIICEDDVMFDLVPFWTTSLQQYVNNAPSNWEILQLQPTHFKDCKPKNLPYSCCRSFGTVFYCVNLKALRKKGWTLEINLPKSCLVAADHMLYAKYITYTNYKFGCVYWKNDTCKSIIHDSHNDSHIVKSLNLIYNTMMNFLYLKMFIERQNNVIQFVKIQWIYQKRDYIIPMSKSNAVWFQSQFKNIAEITFIERLANLELDFDYEGSSCYE